jgi:CCR4-NOT transcription complex subunit 1
MQTEHNLLQHEVLSRVFSPVLMDTAKSNVVKYLWDINPRLTLRGFIHAHSDPNSLLRIVDLCQDLKILSAVLDSAPFPFSIKLAAAASRKYHSHVKKWLIANSVVCKGRFLEECVNFLKEILSSTPMEQPQAEIMNLYWRSFPLFVEVCQPRSEELVSTHLLDENSIVHLDTICNV